MRNVTTCILVKRESASSSAGARRSDLSGCGDGVRGGTAAGPVAAGEQTQGEPPRGGEVLELLVLARRGDRAAIGQVVEQARGFLLFTASRELPKRLTHKLGASDIVQETAFDVQRGFEAFQGKTEAELFAWMRQILRNNIADAVRQYEGTAKRQVSRERSLDDEREWQGHEQLPTRKRTPDESVMGHEDALLVTELLGEMSPQYREVLRLRYWEQCSFMEIGVRMNRSPGAARKLWYRALDQFNTALADRRLQAQAAKARPR